MPRSRRAFIFSSSAQQLSGSVLRHIKKALIGQSFDHTESIGERLTISDPRGQIPAIALRVEYVPPDHGPIADSSIIQIVSDESDIHEIMNRSCSGEANATDATVPSRYVASASWQHGGSSRLEVAVDALQADIVSLLGQFAEYVSVVHPSDESIRARAEQSIEQLVGVPTKELLSAARARLRGTPWLQQWASTHGYQFNMNQLMHNSSIFILSGDPGTGKTQAAHALPGCLAQQISSPVAFIQLSTKIRGKGIQGKGASDILVALSELADMLEKVDIPVILFLDEAEAVGASRAERDLGGGGAQENLAIVDALIVGIDRFFESGRNRGFFVFATNLLRALDPALQRRAWIFEFPRPNAAARKILLEGWFNNILSETELRELFAMVDEHDPGPTAADLLGQIIVPCIFEAAHADSKLGFNAIREKAKNLSPTRSSFE